MLEEELVLLIRRAGEVWVSLVSKIYEDLICQVRTAVRYALACRVSRKGSFPGARQAKKHIGHEERIH
jgi:hypothetical protein